jgi:thiol-disulfide isomerase/thioredoxin
MKLPIVLSWVIAIISCVNLRAQNVVVEGATDISDGKIMYLFLMEGQSGMSVGSDTIRDGKFRIEIPSDSGIRQLNLICLTPEVASMGREIIVGPGTKAFVHAFGPASHTWKVESNQPAQTENDAYILNSIDLWNEVQNKATTVNHDSIYNEIAKRDIQLMRNLPHTEIWMGKFAEHSMGSTFDSCNYKDELIDLYATLTENERRTLNGQRITGFLFPPSVATENQPLIDGDLYDLSGNLHHLSEFKGKWILLDLWSAGCYPCIMTIPELEALSKERPDSLAVISISCDSEKQWRKASEHHKISWNNWNDLKENYGIFQSYYKNAIPAFVIISPEGTVIKKMDGYAKGKLRKEMNNYLNPPTDNE